MGNISVWAKIGLFAVFTIFSVFYIVRYGLDRKSENLKKHSFGFSKGQKAIADQIIKSARIRIWSKCAFSIMINEGILCYSEMFSDTLHTFPIDPIDNIDLKQLHDLRTDRPADVSVEITSNFPSSILIKTGLLTKIVTFLGWLILECVILVWLQYLH